MAQSDAIRDIVIGMADGLTVPFALAAGLTGAVDTNSIIITAGMAEICAGSIAMGLGGYMAGQTEIEHYDSELAREYREIKEFYETEKREVREVFADYGLSEQSQHLIADELAKHDKKWVEFMMRFELGLEKPDANRARNSALNIGIAYIDGGIIPLSAYFFTDKPQDGLAYSSVITILCLLVSRTDTKISLQAFPNPPYTKFGVKHTGCSEFMVDSKIQFRQFEKIESAVSFCKEIQCRQQHLNSNR